MLQDFDNCTSFRKEFDYAIRMSSLKFLKAIAVLSKQYIPSPIDKLLKKRTVEDIAIDRNRYACYAKNKELVREAQERENMSNEMTYMNKLMAQEAKITEKHAKEERKLAREETKKKTSRKEERCVYEKNAPTKRLNRPRKGAPRRPQG